MKYRLYFFSLALILVAGIAQVGCDPGLSIQGNTTFTVTVRLHHLSGGSNAHPRMVQFAIDFDERIVNFSTSRLLDSYEARPFTDNNQDNEFCRMDTHPAFKENRVRCGVWIVNEDIGDGSDFLEMDFDLNAGMSSEVFSFSIVDDITVILEDVEENPAGNPLVGFSLQAILTGQDVSLPNFTETQSVPGYSGLMPYFQDVDIGEISGESRLTGILYASGGLFGYGAQVYARIHDGITWKNPQRVDLNNGAGFGGGRIATHGLDKVIILIQHAIPNGLPRLFARYSSGGSFSDPHYIDNDGIFSNIRSISLDSGGSKAIAAFTQGPNILFANVYSQGSFGTPILLDQDTGGSYSMIDSPQVSCNDSGQAILVYINSVWSPNPDVDYPDTLYARVYNGSGFEDRLEVASDVGSIFHAAMLQNGKAMVVYTKGTSLYYKIYNGSDFEGEKIISLTGNLTGPPVIAAGGGKTFVAFGMDYKYYAATYQYGSLSSPVRIDAGTGYDMPSDIYFFNLVASTTDKALAIFEQPDGILGYRTYINKFDGDRWLGADALDQEASSLFSNIAFSRDGKVGLALFSLAFRSESTLWFNLYTNGY